MQTNVGVSDIEKWGLRWPVSGDDFGVWFFAQVGVIVWCALVLNRAYGQEDGVASASSNPPHM